MDPATWKRVQDLFHRAADLGPAEQAEFLEVSCSGTPEVRRQVEKLLRGDRRDVEVTGSVRRLARDAEDERPASPVGRRIGPYRVERRLGCGGMGDVFLAVRADDSYDKRVAIKVMRSTFPRAELARRFQAERQILATLEHPNIAHLLDGGTTETGEPYVVMEFVDGRPIDRYCKEEGLSIDERLELVREVCAAVQYAHRNLIVHRDIKPGNVLVTDDGRVKLLDFGIAKLLENDSSGAVQTATALRLMTPEHASPEQLRGGAVTTSTDVYSLGVLLYELLTDRRPYSIDTKSIGEFEREVATGEPARPSTLAPQSRRILAGDLDNIVLMALRKEPERRYASVAQLAEDLRRHLEGLPVSARPATTGYRLSKFVGRHRAGIAASVVVTLLIGGLVGFYTARLAAERNEARRAQVEAEQVADFLVRLFKTADPNQNEGEEVTARELLDRGARRVEEQLADQPRVLGTMLDHIGSIYRTLANYPQAEQTLIRALEVRGDALGPEHPETLRSRSDLIELRRLQGRAGEVLDEAFRVLEIRKRVLGPDDDDTLNSMMDLAQIHMDLGRYEDAAGIYEDSLERYVRTQGEKDNGTLWNMNNLAIAYKRLERYEEARALYERTLELRKKVNGAAAPTTLAVMINLANVVRRQGDDTAAADLLETSLEHLPRVMGPAHPYTLAARSNLGMVYLNEARFDEAVALYEETVALYLDLVGSDHRDTLAAMANLGIAHRERGELERAEEIFTEVLSRARATLGDAHPLTVDYRDNLASVTPSR